MSIPKNHHAVPQSYLKRWVFDNNKVFSHSIKDGRLVSSPKSIKSVCSEEFLYSKKGNTPQEEQEIELHFLRHLDNSGNEIIAKIIDNGPRTLSDDECTKFTNYLMSFRVRSKDAVGQLRKYGSEKIKNELITNEMREKYAQDKQTDWPETLEELLISENPYFFDNFSIERLPAIIRGDNVKEYHEMILNMNWFTKDFNHIDENLFTSDKPVYFNSELSDDNFFFYFPLSPKKGLFGAYSDKVKINLLKTNSIKLAKKMNTNILETAFEFVITNFQVDKELIINNFAKRYEPFVM